MSSGKFENVEMKFTRGSEWTPDVFTAKGLGPDNGQGRFGAMTFYYSSNGIWTKFATAVCGSEDNGPNKIEYVQKFGTYPTGVVKVSATLTEDGLPPNGAASVPVAVDFQ